MFYEFKASICVCQWPTVADGSTCISHDAAN